jgi:hypothetical protein
MKHLFVTSFTILLAFMLCNCSKESNNNPPNTAVDSLRLGLIAYYPFNGNANDESGNSYHLTNKGAVLTNNREGQASKAFQFNGIDAVLQIPAISKANSLRDFSIVAWVKPDNARTNYIVSFSPAAQHSYCTSFLMLDYGGYNFFSTSVVTAFTVNLCSSSTNQNPVDNPLSQWSQIVLVQRYFSPNSSSKRYEYTQYFNGKRLSQTLYSEVNPIPTSFDFTGTIGSHVNGYSFFKGSIDDLRIYNRTLSDAEVLQLYNLHE